MILCNKNYVANRAVLEMTNLHTVSAGGRGSAGILRFQTHWSCYNRRETIHVWKRRLRQVLTLIFLVFFVTELLRQELTHIFLIFFVTESGTYSYFLGFLSY